ncbi:phage tail tape measure protein [Clostridium swellfunianum]|uniref:phage tail tape measure protein n=1 Tax=Clostridium swellfunianum TaxID=1367462 RepID=UPI0020306B52|nr:phage tail tape measure protein [Clostridium swellfunianum]MCM0648629.1 phage tail tape measure protein [Clostridium swellfunianum]
MISAGEAVAILSLDTSPFKSSLKSAGQDLKIFVDGTESGGKRIKALGSSITTVGTTLTKGFTLPIVGAGAAATKVFVDFESQMSRVKAISGAAGADFKKLNDEAKRLGASTAFSAKEAAEGMENLASAGFSVNEIMDAMPGMLDLAASGGTDLAVAADIAASTLRGFGLEANQAAHVSDVLAKAAADTNAGIEDTGDAMKYVAPVARAMGLSLEEVTAAIGEMSNAGIKGSQAGTALRASLSRLANPSDEAAKLMKKLGFDAYDSSGKMLPLKDIIAKLQKSMSKLTEEQKQQAIATIFGQEAMSGMLTLIQAGPKELEKLTTSFKNSDGAAKKMADTMKNNLKGQWDNFTGAIEGAAIAVGERLAPMLGKLTEKMNKAVDWFNNLSDAQKDQVVKIGLMVAAVGPLLMVGGKTISTVGALVGGVTKLTGAFKTLTTTTTAVKTVATVANGALGATSVAASTAGASAVASAGGLAGLASGLGGVVLAAAPYLLAAGAVAGAGYLIYKGLKKETNPELALFADRVENTASSVTDSYGEMSTNIQTSTTKISESTKKAVGSYLELDKKATESLQSLKINSSKITKNIADNLSTNFGNMGEQIKLGLKEDFDEQYTIMQDFYAKSNAFSDKEETESLKKLQDNYNFQLEIVDSGNKKINEIIKKATDEKRELKNEEFSIIANIQDNMKKQAIKTLSENEVEAQIILQRMSDYNSKITKQMAQKHIQELNASRDKAVAIANDEYEKVIGAIIRMRDQSGELTAAQADTLIKEAQRQRDGIVDSAEETRQKAVDKIFEMNTELANDVDQTTGKVVKWYEKIFTSWDKWTPSKKFFEYTVTARKNQISSAIPDDGYATGTYSAGSGLKWVGERGPELIDLNGGERIYNAAESTRIANSLTLDGTSVNSNRIEKLLEELNKAITNSRNERSNEVNVTQNIYSTTASPSEVARQTKNNLRRLALEW